MSDMSDHKNAQGNVQENTQENAQENVQKDDQFESADTSDWNDFSLMSLFRIEVETQVSELNKHLISIEQSNVSAGRDYQAHLDALMRAAHSIKGAARIVQVEAAVKVSHALEDCFIAAQQGLLRLSNERVDVLLMGVDLLSKLGSLDERTLSEQLPQHDADVDEIVIAIEEIVSVAEKDSEEQLKNQSTAEQKTRENIRESIRKQETSENSSSVAAEGNSRLRAEDSAKSTGLSTASSTALSTDSTPASQTSFSDSTRTVRMSADNLNRLIGLAGELLVESNWLQPFANALQDMKRQQQSALSRLEQHPDDAAKNSIAAISECQANLNERVEDIEQFSRRFGQLCDRLYREVIASHMCGFEEGTRHYARLVRDIAKRQQKQVSFEIEGLTTQIDRDILSKLDAPITHLLTNAIAHGIETADVRLAKGKPASASVKLSAMHRSGMLVVEVKDDGAGINLEHLKQKVVEKGLVTQSVAANLSKAELTEFLFLPGFSTAAQVDSLAGRGYGLDLARTMAQSVGGSLQVISPIARSDSYKREGTCFRFCLPLTLSVVRSLLFDAAEEAYAVSLSRISRVLKLNKQDIYYSENRPYFRLEQENISLVSVHQILGLPGSLSHKLAQNERLPVIVMGEANQRYGICVDRLLEEKDLVVRPLDTRLGKVPNIGAAALSEAGTPILILDVADVLRSAERAVAGAVSWSEQPNRSLHQHLALSPSDAKEKNQKRVLVVDDSMTVRAMERNLLQNRGYAVDLAVDGAEGWNAVRMNAYDLVITDIDMPRMNGIELIRKMREYEATRKLPIIIVSYKDRETDQLAGLSAGANYYLTKSSFHDDGLITAVVDLIGA